jgi:DNA topoisomerase-2
VTQVRFILAVINNDIVVSNRRKVDIVAELKQQRFKTFYSGAKKEESEEEDSESQEGDAAGYDYLLSMKIWSLTQERVKLNFTSNYLSRC